MRASAGPNSHRDRVAAVSVVALDSWVADGGVAPIDGDLLPHPDGLRAQQQQPLLALLYLRHVLLSDGITVLGHGGDDLVQVRHLTALDHEHVLAPARLQRLQHRRSWQGAHPLLELLRRSRHQGLGADVRRELPQVHPAAGAPQTLRIIHHQRPPQPQPPGEIDQGRAHASRPVPPRVVAQEDHVEAPQVVFLDHRLVRRQRARVVRGTGVIAVTHPPR